MRLLFNHMPLAVIAVCAVMLSTTQAYAERYIIALSPMQDKQSLETALKATAEFMINHAEPGDNIIVLDALGSRMITSYTIPDQPAYQHKKPKMMKGKAFLRDLFQYQEMAVPVTDHGTDGLINLPRFMDFLGRHYAPFEDTRILMIGSPLYMNGKDDNGSMKGMRWYQDGAFNLPLADSPLSLTGRDNTVAAPIYWLIDDSLSQDDAYFDAVRRMWTLYLEGQGATLNSFAADNQTVWNAFISKSDAPPHRYERDMSLSKGELGQIVPEQPDVMTGAALFEQELSKIALTAPMLNQADNVRIGIQWDCVSCDLDLYVRPHRGAEALYFSRKETAEGYYHKDYTQSPETENGYETVSFTSPVDIADMLIAVNLYRGDTGSGTIKGKLRLALGNQVYESTFTIASNNGNQGSGRHTLLETGQAPNAAWVVLNPRDVIGL